MESILVTGGAGYVGSTLVPTLLTEGYKVRVLDNLTYGGFGLLQNFMNENFDFIHGDASDEQIVKKSLKDIDHIIHLAALVGYPACKRYPDVAEKSNVRTTEVIKKLKSSEQWFIYSSTGSVYGVVTDDICTETTPANALSIYGETKVRAENIVLTEDKSIVYRFATAFGISPRLRLDLLINNFVFQVLKNKSLIVYEKSFKRTFIHVDDMAKSFIFAIKNRDKMAGEIYNVGNTSMNYTKEKLCYMIKDRMDYYLHFAEYDGDADKRNYEVSYDKINKLGYNTTISMEQGIDELFKALEVIDIPNIYSNHAIL
ncbi:MAG: dTDP-glucose 4,6-dehydratase [Candidatus Heimdallarchaeota archaeon LC_3]|nr:MAG: dTDP-glucose 4,6-dehydratase [Candidatus Heimdallarchaeota archaeon LC_3]